MRMGAGFLGPGGGRKLAVVAMANAAAFATVGGGVLAGGLHAVSGPDHLAALLPRIMGQKWHNSMRIGATWGLGHGFSAMVIGLAVSTERGGCAGGCAGRGLGRVWIGGGMDGWIGKAGSEMGWCSWADTPPRRRGVQVGRGVPGR